MKRILFIFICSFLLLSNSVFAKSVKFIQITDVQYGRGNSKEILSNAIYDINQMKDIDFVVFTGDNTASPSVDLTKEFLKTAKRLNKPFYVLPGDKDVAKSKHLEKETYAKLLHKELGLFKYPSSLNFVFTKGNVEFIAVDGVKDFMPMPNGYFKQPSLDWLDSQIKKSKNKKVVILQHFPLANKTNNDNLYTGNAIDYIKLINKYDNVISVVSGHFNKNDEVLFQGVYYIVTPSLNQKCYKIIEIDEDNGYQVFTSLVKM